MSKKSKATPDRATPKLRMNGTSDQARVATTQALATAMPQSPDWAQATGVQGALTLVKQGSDALAANATLLGNLRTQLENAMQKQVGLRHDWQVAAGQLLSAVEVFCNGAAEKVTAFGLDVRTRAVASPQAAPVGLVATSGKANGDLVLRWTRGTARHGFVVQHAADKTNAATYTAPMPCTKTRMTLSGLPSGALVYVRLAAVDTTVVPAVGPWSDWVTGTAR